MLTTKRSTIQQLQLQQTKEALAGGAMTIKQSIQSHPIIFFAHTQPVCSPPSSSDTDTTTTT